MSKVQQCPHCNLTILPTNDICPSCNNDVTNLELAKRHQLKRAAREKAQELFASGYTAKRVRNELVGMGVDGQLVDEEIKDFNDDRTEALAERSGHDLLVGFLWLGGGVLVSAISFLAASKTEGEGAYVVAWGAILYGLIRFGIGLSNHLRGSRLRSDDVG